MTRFKSIDAPQQHATNRCKAGRFGVFVLSSDASIERDIFTMLPLGSSAHFTRMDNYETCAERSTDHRSDLKRAADLLAECEGISVLIYGCTSGEICFGHDLITQTIQGVFPNCPVVTPIQSALALASDYRIDEITILSPYSHDLNQKMVQIFDAANVSVDCVFSQKAWEGQSLSSINKSDFHAAVSEIDFGISQALFIPCIALPVINAITSIEKTIGMPVLTSTQVSIWYAIRCCSDIQMIPTGKFGSIFLSKNQSEA